MRRTERRVLPLVSEGGSLVDVLRVLERGAVRAALVSDSNEKLVGIMTDGDVRRALLAGCSLDGPIRPYVNREYTSVSAEAARDEVLELMQAREIDQIPIIDAEGRACGLHLLREIVGAQKRPNWAVVMAGGRGARLGSLTTDTPKPMLRVAGRPILERIVLRLVGHGIQRIFLSVHYLSHVVEDHFGDGSKFGCRIDYLREEQPLGTGGSLSLLPNATEPVVVMNGDLVTQADIGGMLDFHERGHHAVTIGVRRYLHTIPFGCVQLDGERVASFDEKPTLSCQINAGIYVLSPATVKRVPKNQQFQLPDLILGCISEREPVAAFEVEGDWIDVGQRDHLRQARGESV